MRFAVFITMLCVSG